LVTRIHARCRHVRETRPQPLHRYVNSQAYSLQIVRAKGRPPGRDRHHSPYCGGNGCGCAVAEMPADTTQQSGTCVVVETVGCLPYRPAPKTSVLRCSSLHSLSHMRTSMETRRRILYSYFQPECAYGDAGMLSLKNHTLRQLSSCLLCDEMSSTAQRVRWNVETG
jgi:hypothetical protein